MLVLSQNEEVLLDMNSGIVICIRDSESQDEFSLYSYSVTTIYTMQIMGTFSTKEQAKSALLGIYSVYGHGLGVSKIKARFS